MATKINEIVQRVPRNSPLFSSWLAEKGIDRKEQTSYVRSGWIERIGHGVYKFSGATPTAYSVISAYNSQLSKKCHIGASSALDLRGYSHFVPMGKPTAYVFTEENTRIPEWMSAGDWDMTIKHYSSAIFGTDGLGLETITNDGYDLLISSPERAIMECLNMTPVQYSLMDTYYMMEMLTTLRPKLIQQLLEACSSVKVKRLFLYMSEKSGHQWFNALNTDTIDLGSGQRLLTPGGRYISRYQMTISQELADYE
ncbi:MAG: type IV toxin-antitoxin system AbiEi family antitoxin [Bacteroidetes bacterium]|uniref:Type IV toxin-antitoxin system AbiEi family antitoxin n=1 Tax=Candidatus Egerieousia excrementavium TaxID=2840778 RepID=A0A9D9DLM6_9BACT|nr:type IV toxin-antitoxin system AbiEi family antitoxin [Candidatus Egerieousia excrementavium]